MNIVTMDVNIEGKLFLSLDSVISNFKNLFEATWVGEFTFSNVNFRKSKLDYIFLI